MKQELKQKLLQKLSPQQIQLMKLVQLPTLSFEQRVLEELEENPALEVYSPVEEENLPETNYEEDDYSDTTIDTSEINIDEYLSDDEIPSYKLQANNYSEDDDDFEFPAVEQQSFHDYLSSQLHSYKLEEEEYQIADFIIGNLDENGYLRRDPKAIVDDLAFTFGIYTDEKTVRNLLQNYIQKLDPSGVGATSLQECLLIQLKEKEQTPAVKLATKIIENHFESFTKKHFEKIMQKCGVSTDEFRAAVREIERLNPKPGKSYTTSHEKNLNEITPDFTIRIVEGRLELSLNGRNAPDLRISKNFAEMLDTYKETKGSSKEHREAALFVKQKLDSAKWFIDAIKQRQNTLYQTMHAIMEYQKEYFLTGDEEKLKPMILKDIADIIGMDISTVSRVASSKYVETPFGTFLIKDLFSESLTTEEGDEVSTKEIKKHLQLIIDSEDKRKPYTDEKIVELLKEKGYIVARRTVAKYREMLNIPVARMRKQI